MAKTERILGGVIITGIAACLGLIVWPAGPDSASAHTLAPVETTGSVPAQPEVLDPLTESVVGAHDAARPILGASRGVAFANASFVLDPASDGVPIASDVGEVIMGRVKSIQLESRLVADFDGDAELSDADTDQFQQLWETGDPKADLNGDGEIDAVDFAAFVDAYNGQSRVATGGRTFRLHFVTPTVTNGAAGGNGEVEVQLGSQVEFTFETVATPNQ